MRKLVRNCVFVLFVLSLIHPISVNGYYPYELMSRGSVIVEGHTIWGEPGVDLTVLNITYGIDKIWAFEDTGDIVLLYFRLHFRTMLNGEPEENSLHYKPYRLIWQKDASWFMTGAGYEIDFLNGSVFRITIANCRTYSEIIDPYNAEVTLLDGTTGVIRDIYDTLDNSSFEYGEIRQYVESVRLNPLFISPFNYITSPYLEVGQNVSETRKIVDIVEIEIGGKMYETFKVVTNITSRDYYREYYYEKQTGLLVKEEDFEPSKLYIDLGEERTAMVFITVVLSLMLLERRRNKL
ncbi:MAG: hypothetical protein GOP50_02685 [Candidatus Heimdallarchaeota archaeon]|nr:hypothetical protein [Candidatus Heimdallarchaeota archaeon]